MFQTKLSAAREHQQQKKRHPQQQQQHYSNSNRSFSSYLPLKTNDVVGTNTKQETLDGRSNNTTTNHVNAAATTKKQHHTSQAVSSTAAAASYYFYPMTHHRTSQQQQRPLSDLNHSFTSYYHLSRNSNVVATRPFVQESYQTIIRNNCSGKNTVVVVDDTKKNHHHHPITSSSSASSSMNNRSMTSRQSSTAISYLQEAPTQSTESADSSNNDSGDNDDPNHEVGDGIAEVSFSDRSSFWNEWAEEMIHKEEQEYKTNKNTPRNDGGNDDDDDTATDHKMDSGSVPHQVSTITSTIGAGDVSVTMYDDPTIVLEDETPENSLILEEGNDSYMDLQMNNNVGSTITFNNLKVPSKTLSSKDISLKNSVGAAATVTGMVVVPYPSALMVKANNDSTEDDDNELPKELVSKDIGRDLVNNTPVVVTDNNEVVTSPKANQERFEEDHEMTPKVSGSRNVVVDNDTLASGCPIIPDKDDTETVSPMKSVMTEALGDDSHFIEGDDEEEEEQSIIQNISISTLAAMNISQATIQLPTLTLFQQAMEYSSMATDYVQQKQYLLAMEYFQRAIDCYLMNPKKKKQVVVDDTSANVTTSPRISILSAVNIAGCYRNMGTVSRLLERYDEVTVYLCKAEDYYTMGRETVEIRSCESIVTLDGQLLNCDESTTASCLNATNQQNNTTCSYYTSAEDETMCLDGMILETIQSRAHYYIKYQEDKKHAVECHEQCLKHLLHIYKIRGWSTKKDEKEQHDQTQDDEPIREQGVAFVPLSKEQHTSFLVKSLEALGNLYRSLVATSSKSACMILFEDAIDILQCRLEQDESTNDDLIKSVSLILRFLSEIYFERQELDKAVDALHDSTAIKLTASGEPCTEALEVMDKMGAAHEQMENYDKALSCFEQTLFARCRFYGNTHFHVAKSLVNVARVTEKRDGSTQESVELYKAANAIFALHMLSDSPALDKDVENILQLIPTVIRQGRYEKAISDLNLCLAMADEETNSEIKIDKAQIYFDLGRAYLGMKDYKMATRALTSAMKEAGDVKEEDIFALLQRVEFLQREEVNRSVQVQKLTNTSTLSYVPDPTLSFHDITFQLQGDRSIYLLDDVKTKTYNREKTLEKPAPKSMDPLSDILYQSFVKDTEEPDAVAPTIASISPPPDDDKTPLHARIRAKLSKKVAKLIAIIRVKCQNSAHLRNLKKFSKQCLQACKSKLRMGPQPADLNPSAGSKEKGSTLKGEDVVYASFEEPPTSKFKLAVTSIVTKCGLNISSKMTKTAGNLSRSIPFSFIHHHVIITEEDEGGFGCQLVYS